MATQNAPYFTYDRGLEAKNLHLGNIVHDYKNPNALDPYVEKAYTDIEEPAPEWARMTPLGNYALTLGKSSTKAIDADDKRYRVAASAKTTKIEIKDPKKFFNDITLTSNEAKKWLAGRLSAAEKLAPTQEDPHARPQLWMLTGLIIMTHATWSSLSSKGQTFTAGHEAPFDQTGVSAIRRLSVSDGVKPTFGFRATNEDVKTVSGAVIHETGKYPGTRGWAARWQKVDIEILPAEKGKDGVNNQLKLRGSSGPSKIAVVGLHEITHVENEAQEDEMPEDFDEEYWEELLEASEEYQ